MFALWNGIKMFTDPIQAILSELRVAGFEVCAHVHDDVLSTDGLRQFVCCGNHISSHQSRLICEEAKQRQQALLVVFQDGLTDSLSHGTHQENDLLEDGFIGSLVVLLDLLHNIANTIRLNPHASLFENTLNCLTSLDLQFPVSLCEHLDKLWIELFRDVVPG